MPSIESKISLQIPRQKIYQALTDISFITGTIPGVVSVEQKGEHEASWTLDVKKGLIRRRLVFDVHFGFMQKERIIFEAKSKEVSLKGTVSLDQLNNTLTEIRVQLEYEASGPLRHIVNNIVSDMMKQVPKTLAEKLEEYLTA